MTIVVSTSGSSTSGTSSASSIWFFHFHEGLLSIAMIVFLDMRSVLTLL